MPRGIAAVIVVLLGVVLLPPSTTGHSYHLQVSNEIVNGPERVESGNWIAQSFIAPTAFFVSRIALYVADTGTSDSLIVALRGTNALNLPDSVIHSQGSADGPGAAGWLDIELSPRVSLTSSTTYWIVAHNLAGSSGDGYDWWNSGSETAFPNGMGATSSDGGFWTPRGRDFAFRVYGYVQPDLDFNASIASPTVRQGGLVDLHVHLSNAGPGIANAVWVNMTLPPELIYVADDGAAGGGSPLGNQSYAFRDVAPGFRTFTLTLRAGTAVVNGTNVIVRVAIDSTDHVGVVGTPFIRNLSIEIAGGLIPPGRPADGLWWWWVPLILLISLGSVVVLLWRRRSRRILVDEVFVGDQHGLLLAHRSASMVRYQDEDMLVGMFKAIQDFVKDTFSRGVEEAFHALEFGERRVLIERGRGYFIAVVYRGEDRKLLEDRVRNVSRAIDANFGDVIASWNGEVDAVKGIAQLLAGIWQGRAKAPM